MPASQHLRGLPRSHVGGCLRLTEDLLINFSRFSGRPAVLLFHTHKKHMHQSELRKDCRPDMTQHCRVELRGGRTKSQRTGPGTREIPWAGAGQTGT